MVLRDDHARPLPCMQIYIHILTSIQYHGRIMLGMSHVDTLSLGSLTVVWVGDGVACRAEDLILIRTRVVSSVGSIADTPGLSVESAVGSKWDTVLGQDVGSKEVAWLV